MVRTFSIAFSIVFLSSMPVWAAGTTDASPQKPLSFKECGEKYRAAKADGSLGERKWLEYRSLECGIRAAGQQRMGSTAIRSEATASAGLERISFPAQLAEEFSDQKPAQQRMRTCLKSYHANKQAGTLAGLRWVQKGGGYYSLCASKLKSIKA